MVTYVTILDISATAACLHKPVFRQTAVISRNGWIGPQKGKKTIVVLLPWSFSAVHIIKSDYITFFYRYVYLC